MAQWTHASALNRSKRLLNTVHRRFLSTASVAPCDSIRCDFTVSTAQYRVGEGEINPGDAVSHERTQFLGSDIQTKTIEDEAVQLPIFSQYDAGALYC